MMLIGKRLPPFLLTRLLRGATMIRSHFTSNNRFLLTRLLRGATPNRSNWVLNVNFYSRASCEARHVGQLIPFYLDDFYSRASCEARHLWNLIFSLRNPFLLTRLLRGATGRKVYPPPYFEISTHAPLARRDILYGYQAEAN